MNVELVVQAVTALAGLGAFMFGLIGIARSLQLQRLLVRKQQQGLDAAAVKGDPQVRAAMHGLRAPLLWATLLAVCAVAMPSLARWVLA
jgi:hypothetical protein